MSVPLPLPTRRADLIERLAEAAPFDLAVVGGGATGLGIALDATARGFRVVLLESHDFAKGTSSRATKLVHGGVRYLAQGNVSLVREALRERATLLRNAPHLAGPLAFVMPAYRWWEPAFYGFGLGLYDRLAGREALGATRRLDRAQTLSVLPGARGEGLCGGVLYWDGQFEDARLALALARTAAARGALVLNHVAASGLIYEEGRIAGVACEDCESGTRYEVHARAVVNATGVWVDALRTADGVSTGQSTTPIVAPSQGVHLVVDRSFLPGERALLVPSTRDGRVLFAVPWLGRTLLGTTDTPREDIVREPLPFSAELDFILGEAGRYLARAPGRADVTSAWVGLRPLVRTDPADCGDTKRLSREHTVTVSRAGLVTVTGGKWTTYRAMAEDVLERCFESALLARRPAGVTRTLTLVGGDGDPTANRPIALEPGAHLYGSEAAFLGTLPGADRPLGGGLTEAMVRFAARHEYARTVEDVLARRSRLLFLDARLAGALAPEVARLLYEETGHDPDLAGFSTLVQQYAVLPEPV